MAAGVHRLTLPLHGHSIGHVNVYAVEDGSDLLLIDCGWSTWQTRRDLTALIRQIGHQIEDIRTVLLTHCHADHAGMAEWLQEIGAVIGAHPKDALGTGRQLDARVFIRQTARWQAWAGIPEDLRPEATRYAVHQHELSWRGTPSIALHDASVISHGPFTFGTISVPGHTPGSVVFFEANTGLLFTGDTLFSHSNFGPSIRMLEGGDPMSDYLASIGKIRHLNVTRALPGHYEPFTNLNERIAAGVTHHLRRADVIADLTLRRPASAWSTAERMPRRRDWTQLSVPQRISATAEVSAHLARLAQLGAVSTELAPGATTDPMLAP